MCTATYLPVEGGFVLTHNRDEAPSRSAPGIAVELEGERRLFFPRDAEAGGTWIVAASTGFAACLLNGAFVRHRRTPPYRRSRGWVLLDFARLPQPATFFRTYDLEGIEPFTLLYADGNELLEFRWDGQQRYLTAKPIDQPHFWCSVTLYDSEVSAAREQVFRKWLLQHPEPNPQAVRRLHLQGSIGDPENDFCMNRQGRVCTVGVAQLFFTTSTSWLRYRDLIHGREVFRRVKK